MDLILVASIVFILVITLIFFWKNKQKKNVKKEGAQEYEEFMNRMRLVHNEMIRKIENLEKEDFKITNRYKADDLVLEDGFNVLFDENHKKIAVLEFGKEIEVYDGLDILDVKVVEDIETVNDFTDSKDIDHMNYTGGVSPQGVRSIKVGVSLNSLNRPLLILNIRTFQHLTPRDNRYAVEYLNAAKYWESYFKSFQPTVKQEQYLA